MKPLSTHITESFTSSKDFFNNRRKTLTNVQISKEFGEIYQKLFDKLLASYLLSGKRDSENLRETVASEARNIIRSGTEYSYL